MEYLLVAFDTDRAEVDAAALQKETQTRSASSEEDIKKLSTEDLLYHADLFAGLLKNISVDDLKAMTLQQQKDKTAELLASNAENNISAEDAKALTVSDLALLLHAPKIYAVESKRREVERLAKAIEDVPAPKIEEKKPDDKPAEDKPAEDKPAEDKPAEDKPAEDKPAEDKPAEDKPADEKPADEKPADEKPAEEPKPSAEEQKRYDEEKAAAEQKHQAAVKELEELIASLDSAAEVANCDKIDHSAQEQKIKDADAALKELRDENATLKKENEPLEGQTVRGTSAKIFADFLKNRDDLSAQLANINSVLTQTCTVKPADSDDNSNNQQPQTHTTELVLGLAEQWKERTEALKKSLDELTATAGSLKGESMAIKADEDVDLTKVNEAYDNYTKMEQAVSDKANEEKQRRATFDENFVAFDKERQRLLLWCRHQKTNLDSFSDVDDIQEFGASLLNHFPMMEENFQVLLELAEPLLPAVQVQNALLEANEVWLNLQVSAFERLRHTLLEIHQKSKLEDEVRAFADYSTNAKTFLDEMLRLLSVPTDAQSKQYVAPVVTQAEALSKEWDQNHSQLAAHLKDFSMRVEGQRDNYLNLRRAVLARLTFLANSVPNLTNSYRRREEYMRRMTDLKKWVDKKAQGESWAQIRSRIVKIKAMIEVEKEAIAKEEEEDDAPRDSNKNSPKKE